MAHPRSRLPTRTIHPRSRPRNSRRAYVDVPARWGTVHQVTVDDVEQTLVGVAPDGRTRIEWRKPKIDATQRASACCRCPSPTHQRGGHDRRQPRGHLRAGGVRHRGRTHVCTGGGRRRDGARPTLKTKIAVEFELRLGAVRHQASRTVPDSTKDKLAETRSFPGTRPDEHLVVQLVRQLSDHRYLVKSVAENPARPGRGVGVENRVWDVTGRRYRGVHPIDFRLTITGDEAEAGSPNTSTTSIRPHPVRGVYTGKEMEGTIITAHEELWERIQAVIDESNVGADGHVPRREGEPLAGVGARAAHLKNTLITMQSVVAEAEQDGHISTDLAHRLRDVVNSGLTGGGAEWL